MKKKEEPNSLQRILLSDATLAQKIEAIREVNPHFYLLTPKVKLRGDKHGLPK